MKYLTHGILSIIILFSLISEINAQEIKKITLLTSVDNVIFNELTKEILARADVEYKLIKLPWETILLKMKNGEADGVPFMFFKEERTAFIEYTDPIFDTYLEFYALPDSPMPGKLSSFSDLKPYTIGLVKGYAYCKEFENAIKEFELKVDYGIDIEENFKNLNEKRIDCFAIQDFFTAPMFITGKLDKTQFKTIPYQSCKQTLYFGFSKKSPAKGIIPKINQVIAEIKKDGTISRIMGYEKK